MISDPELFEFQALADAASPGPWSGGFDLIQGKNGLVWNHLLEENPWTNPQDITFCAKARTMVPRLLEEVREIKKDMAAQGESYSAYQGTTNSIIQNQLTELRKLRTQLAEAKTLARQHQEQSETNLRLWEKAVEEVVELKKLKTYFHADSEVLRAELRKIEIQLAEAREEIQSLKEIVVMYEDQHVKNILSDVGKS